MMQRSPVGINADTQAATPTELSPRRANLSHARDLTGGFFVKLLLMMIVNAFFVYGLFAAFGIGHWGIFASIVAIMVVVNWVYFSRRAIPAKYLVPGLVFLVVFQVFVMAYTAFIAFTNYGTAHSISRDHAVERILEYNEREMPDTPTYDLSVLMKDDEPFLAIVDNGVALAGSAEQPLEPLEGAVIDGARVTSADGFRVVSSLGELAAIPNLIELRVPWSDDVEEGSLRTPTGLVGIRAVSVMEYDEAKRAMVNTETGVVYVENDHGSFVSPDGTELQPGWRVTVGFENFGRVFTEKRLAEPFISSLVWTFAFGFLSVLTTFAVGLLLAVTFNNMRMRSRAWYRAALILPYAFPGFLSALIWAGMLNRTFGYVNNQLLGGADIAWLTDPTLAKVAIIVVNLWLGFPYMFLISTGALQSIPSDIYEAATIDGAGPVRSFRSLTLPLLLVAVTPLLIASFAFNFNNFSLIYMLTGGGPTYIGNEFKLGHTDILISMVYKIAIEAQGTKDYGLASAMSIFIFVIVGAVSYIGFRRTRQLEEIN